MINLERIFKDYRDSGAMNALVSFGEAVGDHTFLTKSGDLFVVLNAPGVDYECLDASQLDAITRHFEAAIRTFDGRFRVYQYLTKRSHPSIPHESYDDVVLQEAVSNRMAYLEKKKDSLYTLDIYFVVCLEAGRASTLTDRVTGFAAAPVACLRAFFSTEKKVHALEAALDGARELLENKVNSFVVLLGDSVKPSVLGKEDAFRFLHRLLNVAPHKTDGATLRFDSYVDFQACESSLECHRDHLRLDDYYVQVLTLKEPPARTFAHVLRGLQDIPSQFVIATEWRAADSLTMRRLIQSKRRHFHNAKSSLVNYLNQSETGPKDMLIDDAAASQVADLGGCLQELEVNGNSFGEFSLSIVLYDEDRARLKRSVAECFKVFAAFDAPLTEERYNLLNAYLAVLPGNRIFNLRKMWLLNTNYVDLSLLFTLHTGEPRNRHLGAEYLAVFETNHGTPYFLNLHYGETAHTIILGRTGSGKSFLLNFLLTHAQKYRPLTYIFDLGGGYESITKLFNGTYVPVGVEKRSFTINPFSLSPTPENLQFLSTFVRVLVESGGETLSAKDERDLFEQIQNLYTVEPEQRRLLTLASILPRTLRQSLQKWVQGGQYGGLFDNIEDNLTFARFQTFDFEGMDKVPQMLEPLLFYVLHRANASIYDACLSTTFKVFVIDEAWRFFRHQAIKSYIQEGLKTWRKKNAAMILATQSGDDLLHSEMLPVVVESCATKMFLANPGIDLRAYRDAFHLNETEAAQISALAPKRQILVKRPDLAKVVNLNVDPKGYWLYTNSPYDNQKRREAFEQYGFEEGLNNLVRSQK